MSFFASDLELKCILFEQMTSVFIFPRFLWKVCGPQGLKEIAKQNAAHFSPSQGLFGGSVHGVLKITSHTLLFGSLAKTKA